MKTLAETYYKCMEYQIVETETGFQLLLDDSEVESYASLSEVFTALDHMVDSAPNADAADAAKCLTSQLKELV